MNRLLAAADNALDRLARRTRSDTPAAILLLAPALALLATFALWPLLFSLWLSLHGGKFGAGAFVGLENYRAALASPDFHASLRVTLYYVCGVVPLTLGISLAAALALRSILLGRGFFRTILFLPYVTSAVAAAMAWRALLHPQSGPLNAAMAALGLPAQQWLLEPRGVLHLLSGGLVDPALGPSLALCMIILFDVWHGCGFAIVVLLAGLVSLPRELEEAARMDGAGSWGVFRHVIAPLLSPTLFFLAVVGVARAFQAFASFFALTQEGGRALGTTENMVMYLYNQFYVYGYWGYGAAVSVLLSTAIILLTLLQWRIAGRKVFYT